MEHRPGHLPLAVVHPAYLLLARVQPGWRPYLGLDGLVHLGKMRKCSALRAFGLEEVLHPGQLPDPGLDRVQHPVDLVLHPGQRPFRLAWPHLLMMQPQLLVSSGNEK